VPSRPDQPQAPIDPNSESSGPPRPQPFLWPPQPTRPPAAASSPATPPATYVGVGLPPPRFPRLAAAIAQIEETWLGVTSPTLSDRAVEASWNPDSASSYCPRCGLSVGTYEALDPLDAAIPSDAGCRECRGKPLPWDRFVRLGIYTGLLREVVLEVKFSRRRTLGRQIGALLGTAIKSELTRAAIDPARCTLIPIPTHPVRRFLRGIDHTVAICRGVTAATGVPTRRLLARAWRTPQSQLSQARRRKNIKGSMRISRSARALARAADTHIYIIIDDVRTTGATLREACRALSAASPKAAIWVATLASAENTSKSVPASEGPSTLMLT